MGKIDVEYTRGYRENEEYVIKKSKNMTLKEIIEKIYLDKDYEYIFDFIKTPQIKSMIGSIRNRYQINKDEAEDTAIFAITEYFYECEINISKLSESIFIHNLRNKIGKEVQRMMREGYSEKEFTASAFVESDSSLDDFEDNVLNKIDLYNALDQLSVKEKEVLVLRYEEKLKQSQIAEITGLSRSRISEILTEAQEKLKKYMEN